MVAPGNFFLGWSLINLNYSKFKKLITWIYQHLKKYMKYYNFFLQTKRKRKNGLIRDKVGIKNAKMRVIK